MSKENVANGDLIEVYLAVRKMLEVVLYTSLFAHWNGEIIPETIVYNQKMICRMDLTMNN